jgi:LCP family protein required for cell wall assembly
MRRAHSQGGRYRRRRNRPLRRWPRRLLVSANVVVALVLLISGSVYAYARYRINSIPTLPAPHLTQTVKVPHHSSDGLDPENILLIGNETRAGLTNPKEIAALGSPQEYSGSLSDVIMILHLDPATNGASILSIPRDLFVPMPAGSPVGPYQKIDAALNDGPQGPDNLINAIQQDLGIPINHFIELNFDGFENSVNALGGINVYFPEPLYDADSLLDIGQTGCIHLNGTEALALVRARHLQYDPPGNTEPQADWPYDPESDLSRIVRDHTFLRIVASTAESEGFTNPLKANAFIGAIINQITIDSGLKNQLLTLIAHYHNLNPASVPELTLPVTQVAGSDGYFYNGANIGDVDFPDQPADNQVIDEWDGSALAAPVAPTSVQVENYTYTSNLATTTAASLTAAGLHATPTAETEVPATTTETLIQYPTGGLPEALYVMDHLDGALMLQADSALPAGTIQVDAGSTFSVAQPKPVTPPATAYTASGSVTGGAANGSSAAAASSPAATTTTTVPTPGGQTASSSADQEQPWDPRPCPST